MTQGQVDLHIHSNKSSDGSLSPFHIVQLASEMNLEAISITDHDTVAAYPQALQFGEEAGIEVIPGIELTTLYGDREFHLLLPFVSWKKKIIFKLINQASKKRIIEAKERVRKLQEIGFDISWKEMAKNSKSTPPLGVTIAQVLLRKAERKKNPAFKKYFNGASKDFAPYLFYKDYFVKGKPAWVPKQNLNLLDVLKVAHETEGVPVLAHPGAYFQRASREDITILKGNGLQGIEVYSSYHDASQTEHYKKIAEELDLVPIAGSDFHGKIKPHITLGNLREGQYWMVEELRKRKR
jgi:predicted metal-dependent phosphoesterase TrpH